MAADELIRCDRLRQVATAFHLLKMPVECDDVITIDANGATRKFVAIKISLSGLKSKIGRNEMDAATRLPYQLDEKTDAHRISRPDFTGRDLFIFKDDLI